MIKALKENNQAVFDMKLMQIDCILGRATIIPLKKEEFDIINKWEGFSNQYQYKFPYSYKGHSIILKYNEKVQ